MKSVTEQYIDILLATHIVVDKKSETHLVVEGPNGYIDVWPTTGKWIDPGKWIDRQTKQEGFGLRQLLMLIAG